MRIWDVSPEILCRSHLLGEHRELHAVWSILTKGKRGYRNHPETLRWEGRLKALYKRHEALVIEMTKRGYCHKSPLDENLARGAVLQNEFIDPPEKQVHILKKRCSECRIE